MLVRGGARRAMACHALVALLGHPAHGWTLWDTGYAPRIMDATRDWPYRLYRSVTPLKTESFQAVVEQLPGLGLQPQDIRRVIISHFHADHVAGLGDFPDADVLCSHDAYEGIRGRRGWRALMSGFLPGLLPKNLAKRLRFVTRFGGPALADLGATDDLFGDRTLLVMRLPGHARGQLGLLAETVDGPKLFCADGAYMTRSILERRPPHPITRLYTDDWHAVPKTLEALATFAAARPEVALIPTHCPEALAREVNVLRSA
jgi:glyoxylase-like metal-dependent hydrolase (beta-lactamase superfamily II)